MAEKFETVSYVASWKFIQLYFCLVTEYLFFQLFEEQYKVEMQGKDKGLGKSLNTFAISNIESSDHGRHLRTITRKKDEINNRIKRTDGGLGQKEDMG